VTIRVTDAAGNVGVCQTSFTVQDTTAPVVNAPESVTANVGDQCTATVPNVLAQVTASDNCTPSGSLVKSQSPAAGSSVPAGTSIVQVRVADAAGNVTVKSVRLIVRDVTAPHVVSISASPDTIRPANKQMVPVTVSISAVDNCDSSPVSRIVSIESSDPETGNGDRTTPDWVITGPLSAQVRSEVSDADYRVYTVIVSTTDRCGNVTLSSVPVTVLKNKNTPGPLMAALEKIAAKTLAKELAKLEKAKAKK